MRLVNVSLNHDRLANNELNRREKWSTVAANINLWCQKQCDAIYETERGARARPHATRTVDIHSDRAASSHSLALLHFLAPLVFERAKRDGEEDRKMEKLSVINFGVPRKSVRVSTYGFFSVCIRFAKKNVAFKQREKTDGYSTNKNALLLCIYSI